MKYKVFDVVKLNNGNKATILRVDGNKYFAEIVSTSGATIDKKFITADEIKTRIYPNKVFER